MKSTRAWLAVAMKQGRDDLDRRMAAWLAAGEGRDGEDARRVCAVALDGFREWLGLPDEALAERARRVLGDGRAAALACSFLREYLKEEGAMDRLPAPRRAETMALVEAFFLASRPARR